VDYSSLIRQDPSFQGIQMHEFEDCDVWSITS